MSVYTVWNIIRELVEGTRGGLVKLSPARIRRMAERRHVLVDKHFVKAMYMILNYALKDCRAFDGDIAKRHDGGNREVYYVYNRMCVQRKLAEIVEV